MSRVRTVGLAFKLKKSSEELKRELVPSFDSVIEDWLHMVKRTSFSDPYYVLEVTYVTPPLKTFIERVVERLDIPSLVGSPLERGFGFGKTHALIFLWHIFTSDIYHRVNIKVKDEVVRETLVLGVDYSARNPLARIIQELKAYTDPRHPVTRIKDPRLVQAVAEVLRKREHELYTLSSEPLAELITEILERYRDLGGFPRLLLIVDELGFGLAQKLRSFAEKMEKDRREEAEAIYSEANAIVNLLSYLYGKLRGVAGVVIWVLAVQDRREIESIAIKYKDNVAIHDKIIGLLRDLDLQAERYGRGLGGLSLAELSYSPEHALEIARYRVLTTVEGVRLEELQREYIEWLEGLAKQLNLLEAYGQYREEMRRFYPFSLGMINLLKKLMNTLDVPATEFVRTLIAITAEASSNALKLDPQGAYTIGVKHLDIPEVVQVDLMKGYDIEWAEAVADVEFALRKIDGDKREAAEISAKYILAKGATANIMTALESRDLRDVKRYGSTLEEIQLEVLQAFTESKAFQVIEKLGEALEVLRAESARIDERDVEGRKYYQPTILRTVYNMLASYIAREREKLENRASIPLYIQEKGTIPALFKVSIRVEGHPVDLAFIDFGKLENIETLLSDSTFREAQNKGKLLLTLVPIWDIHIFNEIYVKGRSYDDVVEVVAQSLQRVTREGKIPRPLHVVILIPDLSRRNVDRIIDKLATYEGIKLFLRDLDKKEEIISRRLEDYTRVISKRRDLPTILDVEALERLKKALRSRLEREISEARDYALKQLLRLSRELVADILGLYRKVVYYSLDRNAFTVKDVMVSGSVSEQVSEGALTESDLLKYASIVNRFFADIIRMLAYEHDKSQISNAILDSLRKGFVEESYRIDDIVENLMLGTYGVKPLNKDIAEQAVMELNGHKYEVEGKTVIVVVDRSSRLIKLKVEKPEPVSIVEKPEPLQPPRPPEVMIKHASLELPPGFDTNDFRSKLTSLANLLEKLGAEISSVEIKFETASLSTSVVLRKPEDVLSKSYVNALMNLLSRASREEGRTVYVDIDFSREVPEADLRKVLGDYLRVRRSFDRLLPE